MAIAVSGGADSVCLLQVFYENAKAYEIALSAITCEHGIRGEKSLRDLEFVKVFCKERNIPLSVFSASVPARAKESGRGLEEEGRAFRYECFEKILSARKADFVATAHHEGDLAETVLFRLARGTSLAGVNAIRERGGIVRPFLGVSKAEILSYLKERGVPYVADETNDDEQYSRNAIRKNVLPALEEIVHGAGTHIADFARRAGEDDNYLQSLAERSIRREQSEIFVPIDLPRPLFLRAAVTALSELGAWDYGEKLLSEIEKLQGLQSGRRVLFRGAEAVKEGRKIVFHRPLERFAEELPFAAGVFEMGKYRVTIGGKETQDALYADHDKFPAGCVLRTRREGDRFMPFGGKEKSLKKYLTDKKIPARTGAELPLIARGNTVYAVLGVEISELVKVSEETKRRLYFTVEK